MESILTEFSKSDIDLKGRTKGLFKTTCPKCSHSRKHKNDKCLSVNIDEGFFNCHNCGHKGNVKPKMKTEKKEYKIPEYNNTPLSDKALNWFLSRGISKSTILRFKITESMEYMHKFEKEVPCINFNYFRDEQIVNIKFRGPEKTFKMNGGSELIFYGLNLIKDCNVAIICEGEIDALSFYEAGLFYVVSVPNGASKGSMKLEYLDNCWADFEDKDKIILATDNDEPGLMLREELARRLGKDRCLIFQYPDDCKDANEILLKGGPEVLKGCMEYCIPYPIEGITTIADIESEIDYLYENGLQRGNTIGYDRFDELISFKGGELTTVTGIPNSGKSEFIDQIMMRLAVLHNWRWGVFSAENQPVKLHFAKMAEKYVKRSFFTSDVNYKMSRADLDKAKAFINDHYYFINIEDSNMTLDYLLEKVRQLVKKFGINGFLLDPWNYVEHHIPSGYTETQYISEALTKVCRFAKVNNVHIFLVAHPTKIKKDKDDRYLVATLYDISGSAHWFNKTDNGISVYRDFDTNVVDVHIQKIRFKHMGKLGRGSFTWDWHTGTYSEV